MRLLLAIGLMLTVPALPGSCHGTSTTVRISVPPAQSLSGSTAHALPPGIAQQGRLIVRSNIPWVLWASVEGGPVLWRPAASHAWRPLASRPGLHTGTKGRSELVYQILAPRGAFVRFSLAPLP